MYRKTTDVGVLAIDEDERHASGRAELMGDVAGWSLRLGLDGDRRKTRTDGRVPSQGGDFAGIGGVAGFTIDRSDWRAGSAAMLFRRIGPFTPELGARLDRFDGVDAWTAAPRAAIRWQLSETPYASVRLGSLSSGPGTELLRRRARRHDVASDGSDALRRRLRARPP